MKTIDKFIDITNLQPYGATNTLSQQAMALIKEQKAHFDLARKNYAGLEKVLTKTLNFDNFTIKVQFNPERIRSSNAKTDTKSIAERPCFLCLKNLPQQQLGIPIFDNYIILINPFPIFQSHLTIPAFEHKPQQIKNNLIDLLKISKELTGYTVFYNGPKCGASAPDHFHLQAGNCGLMPIEKEVEKLFQSNDLLIDNDNVKIIANQNQIRKFFAIKSANINLTQHYFKTIYNHLEKESDDKEPMLNLLSSYENEQWTVIIFPREKQRPSHFYKEGDEKIVIGPASVEMGGVIIVPREEDFNKINKKLIAEIFEEITIDSAKFQYLKAQIKK